MVNSDGTDAVRTSVPSNRDGSNRCCLHVGKGQWIRNIRIRFVIIYAGVLFFYGMQSTYTNAVLVSIERRFGFDSKQLGTMHAALEIGHITMVIFVAHFFGVRHRPHWIGYGSVLSGFALLLFALPELVFPVDVQLRGKHPEICLASEFSLQKNTVSRTNSTSEFTSSTSGPGDGNHRQGDIGPFALFCVAQALVGLGSTTMQVLGFPYLDDNVSTKTISLYFGFALVIRLFGPSMGSVLGSICTTIYQDFSRPGFSQADPRWVAAWWIGYIPISVGMILFGGLIWLFPSRLPKNTDLEKSDNELDTVRSPEESYGTSYSGTAEKDTVPGTPGLPEEPVAKSWRELFVDLRRLGKIWVYWCQLLVFIIDGIVISGFFHYFPKYYAQAFQVPQSQAALYAGASIGISVMCSIACGSFLTKRFGLQPRHIGIGLAIGSTVFGVGLFASIILGCEATEMHGLPTLAEFRAGHTTFNGSACDASRSCNCRLQDFSPVCDPQTQRNFYSPCFAGCHRNATVFSSTKQKVYENCQCASLDSNADNSTPWSNGSSPVRRLRPGLCEKPCQRNVAILTGLMVFCVFFEKLTMSGQYMVLLRTVDPDLKSLCSGVASIAVALLALLPGPVFVGAIIDSACRLWGTTDYGGRGSCLLYDTDEYRWKFFLSSGLLRLVASCLDAVVLWKVWNLHFDRTKVYLGQTSVRMSESRKSLTQWQQENPSET